MEGSSMNFKKLKPFILLLVGITGLLFLNGCKDDDKYSLNKAWIGMATIEPISSTTYSLRLDDGTTLWSVGGSHLKEYDMSKTQRVLLNFTFLGDNYAGYDYAVRVNAIQNVLTKEAVIATPADRDSFGYDAMKIRNMWVGDGFLNIRFEYLGSGAKSHFINLIQMGDEVNTNNFTFTHNGYNDPEHYRYTGIVSFNFNHLLPTDETQTTINIRLLSFEGEKTYSIKLNTEAENLSEMDIDFSVEIN